MVNEKTLVDIVGKSLLGEKIIEQDGVVLLSLARAVLEAKTVEKLDLNEDREKVIPGLGKLSMPEMVCWNAAVDAMRLVVARDFVKRDALPTKDEIGILLLSKYLGVGPEQAKEIWTGKHYKLKNKELAEIGSTALSERLGGGK